MERSDQERNATEVKRPEARTRRRCVTALEGQDEVGAGDARKLRVVKR
jgi:hypothetical protein